MDTRTVADEMAALFKSGQGQEVGTRFWADDIVSLEPSGPPGMDPAARGRAAVEAKGAWWTENHEVLNATTEGPFVNGDQIGFRFELDVKVKATSQTLHMVEIALYTLKNGKIVEEKFLY